MKGEALKAIVEDLIARAKVGETVGVTLERGLRISARLLPFGPVDDVELSLSRTAGGTASIQEARIIANCAGWSQADIADATTRAGRPCLLLTRGRSPL